MSAKRRPYKHPELGRFRKLVAAGTMNRLVSEAELAGLCQYVNTPRHGGQGDAVLNLFEAMLKLSQLEAPVWDGETDPLIVMKGGMARPNPLLRGIEPTKYEQQLQIDKLQGAINRQLVKFTFHAQVGHRPEPGSLFVVWRAASKESPKLSGGVMSMDAGTTLQLILDLARNGQLTRLRNCRRCQKWFFAVFSHQKFCSLGCQQKHYAHSPEARANRAQYMRGYRQDTMAKRADRHRRKELK